MWTTYDKGIDAAYIYIKKIKKGDVKMTHNVYRPGGMINMDFDRLGVLVGIEVIGAKALLPKEMLNDRTK